MMSRMLNLHLDLTTRRETSHHFLSEFHLCFEIKPSSEIDYLPNAINSGEFHLCHSLLFPLASTCTLEQYVRPIENTSFSQPDKDAMRNNKSRIISSWIKLILYKINRADKRPLFSTDYTEACFAFMDTVCIIFPNGSFPRMTLLLGVSSFNFIPMSLLISSIVYITTSFSYATDIVAVYPLLYLHGELLFFV